MSDALGFEFTVKNSKAKMMIKGHSKFGKFKVSKLMYAIVSLNIFIYAPTC